jgi:hypothetical protein
MKDFPTSGSIVEVLNILSQITDIKERKSAFEDVVIQLAVLGRLGEVGQMILMIPSDLDKLLMFREIFKQLTNVSDMFMLCSLLPGLDGQWAALLQRGQIREAVENLQDINNSMIQELNLRLAITILRYMPQHEQKSIIEQLQELSPDHLIEELLCAIKATRIPS